MSNHRWSWCAVLALAVAAEAAPPRWRVVRSQPFAAPAARAGTVVRGGGDTAHGPGRPGDALDQVNAARATRGLPPYQRDAGLTQGAMACAQNRASNRIEGHTANDFAFGGGARMTGAGAMEPSWGFQACAMYEPGSRAAGAYTVQGRDGRLYHSLFVR